MDVYLLLNVLSFAQLLGQMCLCSLSKLFDIKSLNYYHIYQFVERLVSRFCRIISTNPGCKPQFQSQACLYYFRSAIQRCTNLNCLLILGEKIIGQLRDQVAEIVQQCASGNNVCCMEFQGEDGDYLQWSYCNQLYQRLQF